MDRKEAKEFLPIIKAYSEGKVIQAKIITNNEWVDIDDDDDLTLSCPPSDYRIKPESKYRPFKSQEECWQEMHKHPDFGWIRSKQWGSYTLIGNIGNVIIRSTDECHKDNMNYIYGNYTFTDGEPFGIKEE